METTHDELIAKPIESPKPFPLRAPVRLVQTAVTLSILADWLFYDKPLGVSLLLFVALVVGGLWWNGRHEAIPPAKHNLWLLLPLGFFASMAMLRTNSTLTTLNVLAVLCLLAYVAFFYAAGRVENLNLLGYALLPLRVFGHSLALSAPVIGPTVQEMRQSGNARRRLLPLLRGLALALPVLLVFTFLLSSADLIFADYVEELFSLDIFDHVAEWVWRGMIIVLLSVLLAGGLALALTRRAEDEEQSELERGLAKLPGYFSIGFIETTTVLILVNMLFAAFVGIQFTYLFGGAANVTEAGYTFADYARRGFFELLTVAILTMLLILGLNWLSRRENKGQIRLFNGLGSVLVSLVLVMLVSAWRRMALYEAAFGYTELRLIVYVCMAWLALTLVWFLLTLWVRPDRFAIGALLAVMGFVATLNLINPDAFIARQNLDRYARTGDLDVAYLTSLSDDAVLQLVRGLNLAVGDAEEQLTPACADAWMLDYEEVDCYGTPYEIIWTELDGRYQSLSTDTTWQRWTSFNVARWQAWGVLGFLTKS
jgi:cbb3-type cytochrome oxidase subunit 3